MKRQLFAAFLSLLFLQVCAHGQTYSLTDLGASLDGPSHAQAINNNGQVVGYWSAPDGMHAFLFDAGLVKDLGNLGGTNIYALSINDAGQVAGVAETPSGMQASLYQNGNLTRLGTLGGVNSYAYAINKSGQIVGYIDTADGARAFVYSDGAKIELGTLGGTNSFAFGLNANLQVAGASLTADNRSLHAFFWQTNSIMDLNSFLATPGWELQDARAINDFGQIVGSGIANQREHAFLYAANTVTDLGNLAGGTNSYALGINNYLEVVGASSTTKGVHAFVWRNGVITDLNELIDPNSGWELHEASGINELGQITGSGTLRGTDHAFLITPSTIGTEDVTKSPKRPLVLTPETPAKPLAPFSGGISAPSGGISAMVAPMCAPVPNGIVGWWPGAGNANDLISTNFGSFNGSYASAKVGQGFSYSGSNSLIIPASPVLNVGSGQGFTVEGWIDPYDATARPFLAWGTTNNGAQIWLNANLAGSISGNLLDTNGIPHLFQSVGGLIANNSLQHVAVTYDTTSQNCQLLVNGSLRQTIGLGGSLNFPLLANGGIESPTISGYQYAPTGGTWTFNGGGGIIANGNGTWGGANSGSGAQFAFMQGVGVFSQTVKNWPAGTYSLTFLMTSRPGFSPNDFEVLIDGSVVGYFIPSSSTSFTAVTTTNFTVAAGDHTIAFQGLDTGGGDRTAFIDNISIHIGVSASGFESPTVSGYQYNPTGGAWTFTNSSGIIINGNSTWGSANSGSGSQFAFVQTNGGFYQTITNWPSGTYYLSFLTAGCPASNGNDFQVLLDGLVVGYFNPGTSTSFSSVRTASFSVSAGNHTITFQGLDTAGGDRTAFVDNVLINVGIPNNDFEMPTITGYQYNPTDGTWTFTNNSGLIVSGTGVWGGASSGNGNQYAFVQGVGGFYQTVSNWTSGTYYLTFLATGRPGYGADEFQVLIDGVAIGDFTPPVSTSFSTFTTASFTVAAGSHTIAFVGLASATYASFIDAVSLYAAAPINPQTIGDFTVGYETPAISGASQYFYGLIDELSLYNRALSTAEIQRIYSAGTVGKCMDSLQAPLAPTNLVANAISQTQISLTWDDILYGAGTAISIERKPAGSGSYTVVAQVNSGLSYVDTNLTAGTTYFYRVRGASLTDFSAYSNEAQATTSTTGADIPLGNLSLWLKADCGLAQLNTNAPVSFWWDQSGSGNNATQSTAAYQPVWTTGALNGRPVVHFNGTSQYFNVPNVLTGTTQAEAFAVLKVATNAPSNYPTLWRWGTSGSSYAIPYPNPSGQIADDFGSTVAHNLGVPAQSLTQYHVYEVAGQSGSWSAWINGALQSSTNANTYAVWNQATGLGIDLQYISYNHWFAGDVAEVLIFSQVLTTSQRVAVNDYLNSKYGLVPASPVAPSNLLAQAISPTQVSLTWAETLNQGATQISVERKTGSGGSYAVVAQVGPTLSFIDTNLTAGTTYYYRVQAANLTTWSAYSNEAQTTTPSSGSDMPLSSLALWLKADRGLAQISNGPVNFWADQSGKGNHATQTAGFANEPQWVSAGLNGLPVVHFNGTSQFFNLPNVLTGTTQAEAMVVLRVATNTPTYTPTLWRWGSPPYVEVSYCNPNGQIMDDFGSTVTQNIGVPAQSLMQYHLYGVSAQSGSWSAWINGVQQASISGNTYGVWNQSCGLGADVSYLSYNHYFGGDVAEVLIFAKALTVTERTAVNGYLNSKYALAPSSPSVPSNLVAQAISPTQISLTWAETLNQGATQISIERKTGGGGSYSIVAQLSSAASFLDTNLTAGTSYYYRVRAVNLTTWSAYSNEAQTTTLGSGSEMPLTNLVVWLKADTGLTELGTNNASVNFWADQSGKGNHATQVTAAYQPTWVPAGLNGSPVVRFNGTNSFLNWPNILYGTTNSEALVVLKVANAHPSVVQGLWRIGGTYTQGAYGGAYPDTTGSIWDDFGLYSGVYNVGVPAQPLDQFHLYEVAAQNGSWTAFIDGQTQFTASGTTYGEYYSYFYLGFTGMRYFAGDIAEVIILNRTLTTGERSAATQYLFGKYSMVPSVSITSPTNNSIFVAGNVPLQANASVAGGSLKQVEFYQGTTLLGVSSSQPYSMTWSNVPSGSYAVTARAVGSTLCATSSVVNIRVDAPPAVAITSPEDLTHLPPPASFALSIAASDDYGVSQVQLFLGTNLLATFAGPPYAFSWTNIPTGIYSLTATALASDGFSTTSAPIFIAVDPYSDPSAVADPSGFTSLKVYTPLK